MRIRWNSIKTRVTLLMLIVIVMSIGSMSYYLRAVLRMELEERIGEQQRSTIKLAAEHIDRDFLDRFSTLHTLARKLDSATLANPALAQKYLDQQELITLHFNSGVFITRPDGVAVADYPQIGRTGLNYIDRDYIIAAMKEGKSTVSKPVVGKRVGSPIFAMTIPIRDASGTVIGALSGGTDLSKSSFLDGIGKIRYGEGGGYIVVDPVNRLFVTASNNKSLIMRPLPEPGVNTLLDRRLEGFDGTAVNISSFGNEVLTSSSRIPAAGWFVISTLPAAEAFAPIDVVQRRLLWATILFAFTAVAVMWWMLRRELEPLSDTAKTIAGLSNLVEQPKSLPVSRQDEIGDLISGFNALLGTLGQREQALGEEVMKNRAILLNASDGISVLDRDGNLIDCSDSFCHMLGYTRAELIGMNVFQWDLEFKSRPELVAKILERIGGKGRAEFESRHRRKDGSIYDVEVSKMSFEMNGHQLLVSSYRDISQRKAAREEIRQLNADLERRVAERTKSLDAANRELEAFSYSVAHDLRTPLRSIAGLSQVIGEDYSAKLDERGKDILSRIKIAAIKMGELIDDVLTLTQLTRKEMVAEEVDLSAVAREVIGELSAAEPARRVSYEIASALKVRGDRGLLAILLTNLLGNALKFTGKRADPRIEFGVMERDGVPTYFVRDNGAGFNMIHIGNLFRAFHRLHTASEFPGTGIGLATARRIVQHHGGRIWAEGAVGQGATFYFTLSI